MIRIFSPGPWLLRRALSSLPCCPVCSLFFALASHHCREEFLSCCISSLYLFTFNGLLMMLVPKAPAGQATSGGSIGSGMFNNCLGQQDYLPNTLLWSVLLEYSEAQQAESFGWPVKGKGESSVETHFSAEVWLKVSSTVLTHVAKGHQS